MVAFGTVIQGAAEQLTRKRAKIFGKQNLPPTRRAMKEFNKKYELLVGRF